MPWIVPTQNLIGAQETWPESELELSITSVQLMFVSETLIPWKPNYMLGDRDISWPKENLAHCKGECLEDNYPMQNVFLSLLSVVRGLPAVMDE